jgi:hypothetical protein
VSDADLVAAEEGAQGPRRSKAFEAFQREITKRAGTYPDGTPPAIVRSGGIPRDHSRGGAHLGCSDFRRIFGVNC